MQLLCFLLSYPATWGRAVSQSQLFHRACLGPRSSLPCPTPMWTLPPADLTGACSPLLVPSSTAFFSQVLSRQFKPRGLHQGHLSHRSRASSCCCMASEQLNPTADPIPHPAIPTASFFIHFQTLEGILSSQFCPINMRELFYKFLELSTHPIKEVRSQSPFLHSSSISAVFWGPLRWARRDEGGKHHLSLCPSIPLQMSLGRSAPQRSSSLALTQPEWRRGFQASFAVFQ